MKLLCSGCGEFFYDRSDMYHHLKDDHGMNHNAAFAAVGRAGSVDLLDYLNQKKGVGRSAAPDSHRIKLPPPN